MNPPDKPRVKICCIQDRAEAQLAVAYGAAAIGLVSAMPSGPGVITEDMIAEIAGAVPPAVASFLLTSEREANAIIDQHRRCLTSTIQLCDELPLGAHETIRAALPGIALVQVIHITGEESLDQAKAVAQQVNALLLDSGRPSAAVKELGGTGRTHDWSVSRRIRQTLDIPIFLAGGLQGDNVAEAIRAVRPFGLDLCSSVRTNGHLDEEKLNAFMVAVNEAKLPTGLQPK